VDLHTGYTGSFTDNLHPDATGYAWMAGKWRDALAATLSTESALSLRASPAVQVAAGATLSGNALANHLAVEGVVAPGAAQTGTITATSATLPGTYQCQIDGSSCDRLLVEGELNLTGSTLALSADAPAGRAHVIATYGGSLTGNFATVTGLPEGFELHHDAPRKRLIVGRPYDVWRAFHNLPDATAGAIPDADNDAADDLLEFITGNDPSDPASRPASDTRLQDGPGGSRHLLRAFALPAGTVFAPAGDGSLTATARGVMLRVQGSRDLVNWNEPVAPAAPWSGLPAPPAGHDYQTFSLSAEGPASRGFIRLTATQPGMAAATVMSAPLAKAGDNRLEITAVNSWHNRLGGDLGLAPDKRVTRTNTSCACGNEVLVGGPAMKETPSRTSTRPRTVTQPPGRDQYSPNKGTEKVSEKQQIYPDSGSGLAAVPPDFPRRSNAKTRISP
jgi:hypothetical protein